MSGLEVYFNKHGAVVEQLALAAEQIPEDKIMWKPYKNALPWLTLIDHTAIGRKIIVMSTLKGEPFDFPGCFSDPANQAKSPIEAAAAQRDSWSELVDYIKAQPEGFEKTLVTFTKGREMPVEHLLWFAYEENVHHRGQAWIYARLQGIIPPKVWGTERP
jgi:uncharacterized damage-inducible protein DinB